MKKRPIYTRKQRLLLANQALILKHLFPESAKAYDLDYKALLGGFEARYDPAFLPPAFSTRQCQEVLDILKMFTDLSRSYEQLADRTGIDRADISFRGFFQDPYADGSWYTTEDQPRLYCEYLCKEMGSFEELWNQRSGDVSTEDMGIMDHYRPMLARYKTISRDPFDDPKFMTKAQILHVIGR